MVKIIGVEHRAYISKSGANVKGCNVYYLYPPVGKQIEKTEGLMCASVWMSEETYQKLQRNGGFGPGSVGSFNYDKNGKFFHLSDFSSLPDEDGLGVFGE